MEKAAEIKEIQQTINNIMKDIEQLRGNLEEL